MTGHTRMALNAYQELLNKTYSLLNEPQIMRVCRYLSKAARVFVCGVGSSGLAAREMEMRFMRIGVNIYSILDGDLMRMRAVFQNDTSVVIGISISADSEAVLYFLRESHKNGAKTILITARNKESCEEYCDEMVLIPSLKHLNRSNVISPQFPILVMVDVIYSYYVEQDKFTKEMWHGDTLKALKGRKIDK